MSVQDVSNFKLQFDAKSGVAAINQDVANAVKTAATDSIMSILLGDCDSSKSVAEKAKTTTDDAKALQSFEQQKSVCTSALNSLVQLVQSGKLDLTQFENVLKGQVLQTIKDNNAKGQTVQEQITDLQSQNDDLKSQIQSLNGGSLDGVELDENVNSPLDPNQVDAANNKYSANNNQNNDWSKNGLTNTDWQNGTNNKSTNKTDKSKNANSDKKSQIQDLIAKFNNNAALIGSLQSQLLSISDAQTQEVSKGEETQTQSESKYNDVAANAKDSATNLFQKIGTSIKNLFSSGKSTQLGHQVSNTANATTDTAAGTAATAKAAASGAAAVVTFGATAADSAEWAAKAAKAFASAAVRTGNSVLSGANIVGLATGEQTIGNLVAQQLTNTVNQQISGDIKQVANDILGEKVASYVDPTLTKALQGQSNDDKPKNA